MSSLVLFLFERALALWGSLRVRILGWVFYFCKKKIIGILIGIALYQQIASGGIDIVTVLFPIA